MYLLMGTLELIVCTILLLSMLKIIFIKKINKTSLICTWHSATDFFAYPTFTISCAMLRKQFAK